MQPSTKDIGMTSNDPAAWIGSSERLADALDPGHAARIAAALGGPAPARGDAVAAAVAMGLLHQRRGPGWTGDGWPSLARRFPAAGA